MQPLSAAVGIDDLNVDGGTLAVDFAAIAAARGLREKDLLASGFARRSVTPPYEDPVTLAVNAARPVVDAAGREGIELLVVASESGVDYGKPLSSYIHQFLGLPAQCRNFELKHACYAGTAAIQMATAWVRSGVAPGKKSLVVMTDMARRHVGDPAELTAGTGAVAVVIGEEPRVLEIEAPSGVACREVYDVARPTATAEWGDAVLSLAAYLDLFEEAWAGYRHSAATFVAIDQCFRYLVFHTPLVSLVRQAHRVLLEADLGEIPSSVVDESFDRVIRPGLVHARQLANIYSGSAYAVLAGLLDGDAPLEPGMPIGICSYGSGSCAEIFGARVAASARTTVARHGIAAHLAQRAVVDVPLYERLVSEAETMLTARDYEPARDFVPGHFERCYESRERLVLRQVVDHHRRYAWSTQ